MFLKQLFDFGYRATIDLAQTTRTLSVPINRHFAVDGNSSSYLIHEEIDQNNFIRQQGDVTHLQWTI